MKKVKTKIMRSHDVLLVYSKKKTKAYFKPMYEPHVLKAGKKYKDDSKYLATESEFENSFVEEVEINRNEIDIQT